MTIFYYITTLESQNTGIRGHIGIDAVSRMNGVSRTRFVKVGDSQKCSLGKSLVERCKPRGIGAEVDTANGN